MRILHVLHTYPPATHGGIETYVAMLCQAQRSIGHSAFVLCGSSPKQDVATASDESVSGIPVHRLPPPEDANLLGQSDTQRRRLLRHSARTDPDLVHLHHWHGLSIDCVDALRSAGWPVVVTLHDFLPTCPFLFRLRDHGAVCGPGLERSACVEHARSVTRGTPEVVHDALLRRERMFRRELEQASVVLAISRRQRELLSAIPWLNGIRIGEVSLPAPATPPGGRASEREPPGSPASPPGGCETAPVEVHFAGSRQRSVDLPAHRPLAAPPPELDLRIVTWGGLVFGKGLHVLVDACERLRAPERLGIEHHGRVIDEAYRQRLIGAARRVRLRFRGRFDPATARDEFPHADIAVFPSLFMETHGYAVDEALQAGLPVVVTDRGAPQDRVAPRGVVVPAGDAAALAAVLQGLVDRPDRLAKLRSGPAPSLLSMADHLAALDETYRSAGQRSRGS